MERMTEEMDKRETFALLLNGVRAILDEDLPRDDRLGAICTLLKEEIPYYHWVGFYLTDPEKADELVLGPFDGAPTEHTRIPFGRGICGQAAQTKQAFVVQDVTKESNYLSCSIDVRSEIVVPILSEKGDVLGELDIDSHDVGPFSDEDREFLEKVCGMVLGVLNK